MADGDVPVDTEHTLQDGTRVRLFAVESSGYPGGVNDRFQYYNPETGGSLLRYDKFEPVADVQQLLTDRRIELMRTLVTDTPESISALADRLNRNYADVHSDIGVLADHHIVYFETDGQSKRPVIPYDRVRVDIEVVGDTETDHAVA